MDYCFVLTLIAIPIALATVIVFVETNKYEKQINKLHNKKNRTNEICNKRSKS